jgi:hypothetical protein
LEKRQRLKSLLLMAGTAWCLNQSGLPGHTVRLHIKKKQQQTVTFPLPLRVAEIHSLPMLESAFQSPLRQTS